MKSLESPGVAAALARQIHHDINQYAIDTYFDAFRWHLGASLIGHECSRYLWLSFRWCGKQEGMITARDENQHTNLGRMLRLFNRGHREEERFIEFLKGIGCEVWTHEPDGNQFRMSAVNGHFGGSIDGVIRLPARYEIDIPLLTEFKTNGTGKGFAELKEKGLEVAKTQHYIQQSVYGKHMKLEHAAYFNVNKNDDDLHVQVVKLNWKLAEQMEAKAERIITTDEPPPRLSDNPTFWKCKSCSMFPVCHDNKAPERNCRSCAAAKPSLDPATPKEWVCTLASKNIPKDIVPIGCEHYKAILNG